MKNTMKLNALGILVALTVAGQAEAGVGSWFSPRGPKAPELPKFTPKAQAPSNSGKAEWVMAGLSAFGGQIASGVKSGATKVAAGYKVAKAATVAASKTGAAKFAALPVKVKAVGALAAGSVLAYGAYRGGKALYARYKAPKATETPKAPEALVHTCDTEKEAYAKLGYLGRAKVQAVAAKDAVVAGLKKPFAGANVDATKQAEAKKAADAKAAADAAQVAADAKLAADLAAQEAARVKRVQDKEAARQACIDWTKANNNVNPNSSEEYRKLEAIYKSL